MGRCLLLLLPFLCFAEERVFFLHIPKSGGMSFRLLLADRYAARECFIDTWLATNPENVNRQVKNIKFLSGHFLYSLMREPCRDFVKVTFLREPVARVLSEQRYCLYNGFKDFPLVLREHFLPPDGEPIYTAANIACKLLSQLDPQDPNITIAQHLESAKETLVRDFDFVGITEELEESIALFFASRGWKQPEKIPQYNVTNPALTRYPRTLLQEIAERNWADIELYAFAKELYAEEKKTAALPIKEEPLEWVDQIDDLFRGSLDGVGWCLRDYASNWGIFRWICSAEKGYIDYPLDASNSYSFEVDLRIDPSLLPKLSLSINGVALLYTGAYCGNDQWYTCSGVIPSTLLVSGQKTRLGIAILDPKRLVPKDFYRGRCACKRIAMQKI